MFRRKITGGVQCRFSRIKDIGFQHIERQEEGHRGFLPDSFYKKTTSPVLLAQGMDDDGILTELGGVQNYESGVYGHIFVI